MSNSTARVAAKIIAVGNLKGGVGKSTTTYHLARSAHLKKLRVLILDMDHQGNLTRSISMDQLTPKTLNLADVLAEGSDVSLKDTVVPGLWEGIDVIPTVGVALTKVENELSATPLGGESRLKREIQEAFEPDSYDLILIDCPPAIGLLTINALVAADTVLLITEADQNSMDGMVKMINNVNQVKKYYNESLEVAGIVINRVPKNHLDEEFHIQEIHKGADQRGLTVFNPVIPRRKAVGAAYLNGYALDSPLGVRREELEKNLAISWTYDKYLSEILGKEIENDI